MNAKKKALEALQASGYRFGRHGANHDIYINTELGVMIPIRHHFTDADLKVILKEIETYNRRRKT